MIETKLFEVRDRMTYLPVLAVKPVSSVPEEGYHFRRLGFPVYTDLIFISCLTSGKATYDPYKWSSVTRTMQVAHEYIQKNFDTLESGAVVDVEFILGETSEPKESERIV